MSFSLKICSSFYLIRSKLRIAHTVCPRTAIQPHTPPGLSRSFQSLGLTTQFFPGPRKLSTFLTQSFCILSVSRGPALALALPYPEGTGARLDPNPHDYKCPTKQGLCSLVPGQHCRAEFCHHGVLGATWRNLTSGSYTELRALEWRLMSLNCTSDFCFSLITQTDLLCAPPCPTPWLLELGRAGGYMTTELVLDNLLVVLD